MQLSTKKSYNAISPSKTVFFAVCLTLAIITILVLPSYVFAENPRSASVSATVLPTPENTKPKRQKNFFEKMDPYQQMTFASAAGLGAIVLGAGVVFVLRRNKKKSIG